MATPLSDERTPLTLVKDDATPVDVTRSWVVEKRPRPAWMMSGQQLRQDTHIRAYRSGYRE